MDEQPNDNQKKDTGITVILKLLLFIIVIIVVVLAIKYFTGL
jgi:hypothetical protein